MVRIFLVFSRIWIEYGEIFRISPYSVRIRENMDQKNSMNMDTFHAVQGLTFFKYSFGDWWLSVYSKPTVASCFGKYPVNIYLFKINNRNTRKRCQKCLKLTIKTPERRHWYHFGVFIVNFEHISHLFAVSLLLT